MVTSRKGSLYQVCTHLQIAEFDSMLTLKQSWWKVVLPSKYRWLMWHGRCNRDNMYIMCVCVYLFVCTIQTYLFSSIYILAMERNCTKCVHLHNAPYFSCPIINQLVKLLRNYNACESMTLHDCKEYA